MQSGYPGASLQNIQNDKSTKKSDSSTPFSGKTAAALENSFADLSFGKSNIENRSFGKSCEAKEKVKSKFQDQLGGVALLPHNASPRCAHCQKPLYLLTQFKSTVAYPRYIWVFGCNTLKCMNHGGLVCFRYIEPARQVTTVVQKSGFSTNWDDEEEDSFSFQTVQYQTSANQDIQVEWYTNETSFPGYLLEFDDSPDGELDLDHEKRLYEEYQKNNPMDVVVDQGEWNGEAYESTPDAIKYFTKFSERMQRDPQACVWYEFNGKPQWYAPPISVPPCACGARRVFEFQLLPSLLQLLKVDAHNMIKVNLEDLLEASGMDWSTVLIFVCEQDCGVGEWKEEVAIPQGDLIKT